MYRIAIASVCLWAFSVGCGGDSSPTTAPAPAPPAPAPAPPAPPPVPVPPGVPSGLRVSASGAAFIEWTWSAVEGANGYDAQFSTDEAFTDADEVIARAAGELSYRREGLAASTSAYLRVRAASGTGDERITSEWSAHVAGMTAAPPTPPPTGRSFGAGTWLVGSDIEPGRYFTNPRDGCYWERLSGLGGTLADTIANEFIGFDSPQEIVDIDPSDRAFNTTADCGTWDQSPVSPPPAGTIPPGTWLVGGQVAPGVYEVDTGEGCYWERLSGFGGVLDDLLANDFVSGGGRQLVEIERGDVGFSNNADCGTWRSISGATGLPGGTTASETIEANRLLHEARRDRRRH